MVPIGILAIRGRSRFDLEPAIFLIAGGADPERMAAPRVEEYVAQLFAGSNVSVQVISDQETFLQEYPLFACVNRAASVIPRHAGRIIFLTYEPPNPASVLETLLLVGKGVTYDTGGADIKYGGKMAGMSRDKCGAAASAGFMQVSIIKMQNRIFQSLLNWVYTVRSKIHISYIHECDGDALLMRRLLYEFCPESIRPCVLILYLILLWSKEGIYHLKRTSLRPPTK